MDRWDQGGRISCGVAVSNACIGIYLFFVVVIEYCFFLGVSSVRIVFGVCSRGVWLVFLCGDSLVNWVYERIFLCGERFCRGRFWGWFFGQVFLGVFSIERVILRTCIF